MEAHVATFLDEISRWAPGRPDVRAAVLLGSQARVDAPADPASDVDVALFVDEPHSYLNDTAWIDHFGEPLLSFREPTAVGGFEEQRVLFRDGLEVDFAIVPAAVAEEIPPEADAVFVFIHGGGDVGWYWHLVEAELRGRGYDSVAPDLPCDDDTAGLSEYTDTVLQAIGDRRELIVVAQSLGAYTAPLVCERTRVELLLLVAGLIPQPGEAGRDWWTNTGYESHSRSDDDDVVSVFYHDVPPELAAEALERGRDQSDTPGEEPWPLAAWPDVDTRFLVCRNDRFLPADFMRRVVRDRLSITPDEIESGHCPALSRPTELAERLDAYQR